MVRVYFQSINAVLENNSDCSLYYEDRSFLSYYREY